ncbi:chaperonin 10-like protein [Mycena epipterygia]|nr:chaperonin 10-like protein [Mycena epipterygia]
MFQFALVYSADRKKTIQSQPIPEPSKGFVQARVEAAAFNPVDYKMYDGLPLVQKYPAVLGGDGAGEVTKIGPGVTRFKGRISADVRITAKIPNSLENDSASSFPVNGNTAAGELYCQLKFTEPWLCGEGAYNGEKIVILGGSSSVGSFGVRHTYNDAPWHGDDGWLPALKKSADKAGVSFKRPPRGPITPPHLRAFRASLDINSPFGAASWSAALAAYWGCRRLGELLIRSAAKFSVLRDTCRSTRVSRSLVNGRAVRSIHLVWTKTTQTAGGECFLTAVLGVDADLCPVVAFDNHERVNFAPPPDTPLFAYRSSSGWTHLTKDIFLRRSSAVFTSSQLDLVFGHSYRIGGSLELLSAGVAPEMIMKLGG